MPISNWGPLLPAGPSPPSLSPDFIAMIRSMTAFGTAKAETELGSLVVEIRSVNSRYLDINFRLPEELRLVETVLR